MMRRLLVFVSAVLLICAGTAYAVNVPPNGTYVTDFIANGDGTAPWGDQDVTVSWMWDGATTMGIRMASRRSPSSM